MNSDTDRYNLNTYQYIQIHTNTAKQAHTFRFLILKHCAEIRLLTHHILALDNMHWVARLYVLCLHSVMAMLMLERGTRPFIAHFARLTIFDHRKPILIGDLRPPPVIIGYKGHIPPTVTRKGWRV